MRILSVERHDRVAEIGGGPESAARAGGRMAGETPGRNEETRTETGHAGRNQPVVVEVVVEGTDVAPVMSLSAASTASSTLVVAGSSGATTSGEIP